MTTNKLAIIGGSGLYDVEEFKERELLDLQTPWGKPSDQILKTKYNSKEVYFLPRHGRGHFVSPSNINFRANIDALKQLGVTDIVSVSAVGSLKENLPPGKFVIVDQFIDRTFARNKTFFDDEIVAHVSMAHPTSNGLMNACEEAIKKSKLSPERDVMISLDVASSEFYKQNKYKLAAAQTLLDRVGVTKVDKVDVNHTVNSGIFLMPDKAPLDLPEDQYEDISNWSY